MFGRFAYEITVMENVMMITMMTAVMMMNAAQEQSQETKPLTRRSHLLFCSNLSMSREGCSWRHPVADAEATLTLRSQTQAPPLLVTRCDM